MKSKAIVLALLAFAIGRMWAVSVTEQEVAVAASAWAGTGEALGVTFDRQVGSTERLQSDDGDAFYVVRMRGGGTIVMSSDTESEPIVAFSANPNLDLSKGSKLLDLLCSDAHARAKLRAVPSAATAISRSAGTAAPANAMTAKWAALLQKATPSAATSVSSAATASAKPVDSVSDLRRAPLLQSKWNQSAGGGGYCWNYYTPNHIACGCTATAAAQIMRYFTYPTQEMTPRSFSCKVEGVSKTLTTKGGVYDWANMPLTLSGTVSDVKREAIGRLAYDIGVTLGTSYSAADGGSASPEKLGTLYQAFKYANGYVFWDDSSYYTGKGGLHELALRKRIIYANLDAKRPVQLAIYGYPKSHVGDDAYWSGHSVVGDGYGFKDIGGEPTAFVHINMGWGGTDDVWYNIPEIDAANSGAHIGDSGYDFLYMGGAAFNIFTDEAGLDIFSGRVLDDDGKPVSGATVRAEDGNGEVATTTTDAKGIYAFELPGGVDYAVSAVTADGFVGDLPAKRLPKTEGNGDRLVSSSSSVGNSWGNDIAISSPRVRIVGVSETFSRLDKALLAARGVAPAVIEVIADTELRQPFTIDFPCEIRSAGGTFTVTRKAGAGFTVAAGGSLRLEDIAFAGSDETFIDVAAGGNFTLGSGTDLGLGDETVAVHTADADGFTLACKLERGMAIDCETAKAVDSPFGSVIGLSAADATEAAAKIVNPNDPFGETRGVVQNGTDLVWGEIPVPVDQAVGYYVSTDGVTTNTAARLDRLLPKFMNALSDGTVGDANQLTILKSGLLSSGTFTCRHDFTIRSLDGVVISNAVEKSTVGFTVTKGTMTVRNVTFRDFRGGPFIVVNGATAAVELEAGVRLENIARTGDSDGSGHGPIAVLQGRFAVHPGAEIVGCRAESTSGGGLYLKGAGCELEFDGGLISNCFANVNGGGLYVGSGAKVRLSNAARICANTAKKSGQTVSDDVFLASASIVVGNALMGADVGIRSSGAMTKLASVFAKGTQALGAQELETAAKAFRNQVHPEYAAVPSGKSLAWAKSAPGLEHQPLDPSEADRAAARIKKADGTVEYWEAAQWALDSIVKGNGAVNVVLLKDGYLDRNIGLHADVTVESEGGPWTLSRTPGMGIDVYGDGSLTLKKVTLNGIYSEDDKPSQRPFVKVYGGKVVLKSGAVVQNVRGSKVRDAGAIVVCERGEFRMEAGAVVQDCTNTFLNLGEGSCCGGVMVDNADAYLKGGNITRCSAYKSGGLFVCNTGKVHVVGKVVIQGNAALDGAPVNLLVADLSKLFLDGKMTGKIGYLEGVSGDRNVFGQVNYDGADADLVTSAHNFTHDSNGDVGMVAAKSGQPKLLVWSEALDTKGRYTDEQGKVYTLIGGNEYPVAAPTVVTGLVYNGSEQAGVNEGIGYDLVNSTAIPAGGYVATAKVRPGFVWEDGGTADKKLSWSIAKATYDMSGVTFSDGSFVYDGEPKFIYVTGTLPAGVTVAYEGNGKIEVGEYTVVATFAGDAKNYEPIVEEMTAKLTIQNDTPEPPDPPTPVPFKFVAIEHQADGTWLLTISPVVKGCKYTLRTSDDVTVDRSTWTPVGSEVEATEDGVLNFNPADGELQRFWDAIGAEPAP